MKKRFFGLFILIVTLMFCSCQTSLQVKTLVPAKISLGNVKTVAVAPVEVDALSYLSHDNSVLLKVDSAVTIPQEIAGFKTTRSYYDCEELANSMASVFENALNQGVYSVMGSTSTAALITNANRSGKTVRSTLQANDIDAIVTSEIDNIACEEFISCVKNNNGTYFILNQRVKFSVSYIAQNVDTLEVIDTFSFDADSLKKYGGYIQTILGVLVDGKYQTIATDRYIPKFSAIMTTLCSEFTVSIRDRLTPHYETNYVWLLGDNGSNEEIKYANKLVEKGSYEAALTIYLKNWNTYKDSDAGYNAAAVYYAMGQYEEALELCSKVSSTKSIELYWEIKKNVEKQQTALDQLNGTADADSYSELLGF